MFISLFSVELQNIKTPPVDSINNPTHHIGCDQFSPSPFNKSKLQIPRIVSLIKFFIIILI